jgi:hypothetical protein
MMASAARGIADLLTCDLVEMVECLADGPGIDVGEDPMAPANERMWQGQCRDRATRR